MFNCLCRWRFHFHSTPNGSSSSCRNLSNPTLQLAKLGFSSHLVALRSASYLCLVKTYGLHMGSAFLSPLFFPLRDGREHRLLVQDADG